MFLKEDHCGTDQLVAGCHRPQGREYQLLRTGRYGFLASGQCQSRLLCQCLPLQLRVSDMLIPEVILTT